MAESPEKSPFGAKAAIPARVLPPRAAPCPTPARICMNVQQIHQAQTCRDWWRSVSSHQPEAIVAEPTSHCKRTKPRQPQKHPANANHGKRLTCPARLPFQLPPPYQHPANGNLLMPFQLPPPREAELQNWHVVGKFNNMPILFKVVNGMAR